ncbi:7518_t:CDS:1, partial [Ambispora gerdemannii]
MAACQHEFTRQLNRQMTIKCPKYSYNYSQLPNDDIINNIYTAINIKEEEVKVPFWPLPDSQSPPQIYHPDP